LMYVGLDVHKRFCYGTTMNEIGEVVLESGNMVSTVVCLRQRQILRVEIHNA
jgi:hypothetical protein